MARIFHANPHFKPAKWKWYLGLWAASADWNNTSIAASAYADYAGYSNYNGGADDGDTKPSLPGNPDTVFGTLTRSSVTLKGRTSIAATDAALVARLAAASAGRSKPILPAHYEAGPGYAVSGATPAEYILQNQLKSSVGNGTATLDAFLLDAASGIQHNDYFTFGPGRTYASHMGKSEGRGEVPGFTWFKFIQKWMIGKVSRIALERGVPIVLPDTAAFAGAVTDGSPWIRIYRCKRPDGKFTFAVLNVSPDLPQTIRLLKPAGGTWTRYWMDGPHTRFNSTVETKDSITLQSAPAPAWSGSEVTLTIGPGLAEAFVEG